MLCDVVLPWPPSTNSIWRSVAIGHGRTRVLKSKAYRQWREIAEDAVRDVWRVEPYDGVVSVKMRLCGPSRRSYDIDNRIKAVLDLLQGTVIVDDGQVDRIVVSRGEPVKGGQAWISVETMKGTEPAMPL